ncbi:MAG: hypothetical protein JRG90_17095 [Deltaproteobacteria bacterium]|nr:hypothetical protein [Deltaproteobacteria bacterium]
MPADDVLWSNDHEMILSVWPESRERNPESTIQRRQFQFGAFLGIRSKLLLQSQIDDRLFSMISKEGDDAMEEERCETDQGAHGERDLARFLCPERA